MFGKKKKWFDSLCWKGLIQAGGVVGYCGLVGMVFWNGNEWFGKMNSYRGPVLFLSLFVVSVLISGLLVFYYPYVLFWEKDKKKEALRLVANTAGWLLFFVLAGMVCLVLCN